jgi:hypothetical protein
MGNLSAKDQQGIAIIAVVIAVAIGMVAYNSHLSARAKPDERNCVAPISRKTVFVIDQSDAIPSQTITEIRNRALQTVANDVQANELVSVYLVSDEARTRLTAIFSACKPEQQGSELTEDVKAIKRRFKENFQKPLEAALSLHPPKSVASPLAEVIVDLSLSDHLRAPDNRLVVFSDMMQNSSNTSLYQCADAKSAIANYREHRSGAVQRPTFKNTDVRLNFIPREGVGPEVAACRTGFWSWFFGDNEGPNSNLATDYLPGGAKIP